MDAVHSSIVFKQKHTYTHKVSKTQNNIRNEIKFRSN